MSRIQQAITTRMDAVRKGEADKGFTLVELLVVIIIIGILAAIAVPVFLGVREGAWKSSVESDVHNTVLALEQYSISHNGSYVGATEVTQSDGNTVTLGTLTSTDYTITATNADYGTSHVYTYTSASGKGTWS